VKATQQTSKPDQTAPEQETAASTATVTETTPSLFAPQQPSAEPRRRLTRRREKCNAMIEAKVRLAAFTYMGVNRSGIRRRWSQLQSGIYSIESELTRRITERSLGEHFCFDHGVALLPSLR